MFKKFKTTFKNKFKTRFKKKRKKQDAPGVPRDEELSDPGWEFESYSSSADDSPSAARWLN